jgi:4-amino-4-deoxy-L-arabinose transferase-like glycosyltransferase
MHDSAGQRISPVTASVVALLTFILLSVALRLFSFLPSVIDHDESSYIVIADGILAGRTYQVDYIDTKPPGIYLIYAGLMALFGGAIPMLRLIATLVIGSTAFLIQRAKTRAGGTPAEGFAAGIIYILLTSTWHHWGVAPNTEIFFNLFTILAVWVFLGSGETGSRFLMAGLLLGLGFLIKQVVAFEAAVLTVFLLWTSHREGRTLGSTLGRAAMLTLGVATPFLLSLCYYWSIGHLSDYLFHSFVVPSRYPSSRDFLHYVKFSGDFLLRFLPATIFFVIALRHRSVGRITRELGLLWSAAALAAVLVPGRYFEHYFVQLMLPFSFVAGSFFAIPRASLPAWIRWIRRPTVGYSLLGLLLLTGIGYPALAYSPDDDTPRLIAERVRTHLQAEDEVYAGYHQIVYHLLDRLPPTRYVQPSLTREQRHIQAMRIRIGDELERIVRARPLFLIFDPEDAMEGLVELARSEYETMHRLDDGVMIFERVDRRRSDRDGSTPHAESPDRFRSP